MAAGNTAKSWCCDGRRSQTGTVVVPGESAGRCTHPPTSATTHPPSHRAHAFLQVTKRVLLATAIVSCGCILLVVFGNHESPTLSTHDLLQLYHA